MFKRLTGTRDILPEEVRYWQKIENIARKIFSLYNYQEIRTPLIEEISLFSRSLGESSEVVNKQMFLLKESDYVLRPEATASVVRAYLENNLDKRAGLVKLYYIGPMFRYERPQKGRLRQFHHLGCETIGSFDWSLDVEIISLADHLLKELLVKDYSIKINSLGCAQDRVSFTEALLTFLREKKDKLCLDCKERYKKNPLRILDCKNQECQKILQNWQIPDYLCSDCKLHFDNVKTGLKELGINYEYMPFLVRGLDYYTRTVFEIKHPQLGSQDAIGAGGRYDNLVKDLKGPSLGAMGFALGIERVILVSGLVSQKEEQDNLVYILALDQNAKKTALQLLYRLRKNSISSDTDYQQKSLKAGLRKANDLKARFVLILGENELKNNTVTLKDMKQGSQREVKIQEIEKELLKELKC